MIDDAGVLAAINALQVNYVRALDTRHMEGWLDCFDGAGSYFCISRENEEQGLPLALMMDDCPERLRDRVSYVTEVWAGTFEDYETRHFVQLLDCAEEAPGLYAVTSNFMVVYTSARNQSDVLVAGDYRDRVALSDGVARLRSRRAVLDAAVVPRYLVYPV